MIEITFNGIEIYMLGCLYFLVFWLGILIGGVYKIRDSLKSGSKNLNKVGGQNGRKRNTNKSS